MSNKVTTGSIKRNIVLSVAVQAISLIVSFILNLILPKFISELEYSHWQAYVLYSGYVGVLHFGILDGLVLRYSQYDYDELDKPRIRSQFVLLLLLYSALSSIAVLTALIFVGGVSKQILILVAAAIISKNVFTYSSYTLQITNRIDKYAMLILVQRLFYGISIVALIAMHTKHFAAYCLCDICADLFGCIVIYKYNSKLYFGKLIGLKAALYEAKENIAAGIMLLIANWSNNFLVGSAKMIVQWHWDELTFGKVSFSFSMSNLFLAFVTAISVVLFPSLKRMDKDKLPKMYMSIRNAISPLLFFAMLFYFPGCFILERWLPKYQPSLVYLGILLPIIIYTSKVSLLTNNYLKAYRKERAMFLINVISVAIACGVFAFCAYVADDLTVLLITIVLAVMLRSVVSEIVVMKIIGIKMVSDFIIEAAMTLIFVLCAKLLPLMAGFAVYLVFLAVYIYFYRESIKPYINMLLRKISRSGDK